MYNNLKNSVFTTEKDINSVKLQNLKLEQEKEFKMEEINHLKTKIIKVSKEFDDFKLSLNNVS